MPQSLSNMLVHLAFSTKGRRALLRPDELRAEMPKCGMEGPTDSTPSGLTVSFLHATQGSRCAAPLGYVMEPLRGSPDGP